MTHKNQTSKKMHTDYEIKPCGRGYELYSRGSLVGWFDTKRKAKKYAKQ